MATLSGAMREALAKAGIEGEINPQRSQPIRPVRASSLLTKISSRSTIIISGVTTAPTRRRREITALARGAGLEALDWCGGVYSHEWGFAKLLHFLRHNPDKRERVATALEHCDMVAATLCGITTVKDLPRSICAMGHKWMWGEPWGGLPPQDFLERVDPLLAGINENCEGRYGTSREIAGTLSPEWAEKLGLKAGIPIPVGAFDAHWDAVGSGCRVGDAADEHRYLDVCHCARRARHEAGCRHLRRGSGQRHSGPRRCRGRAIGNRRHLRGDCAPRQQ